MGRKSREKRERQISQPSYTPPTRKEVLLHKVNLHIVALVIFSLPVALLLAFLISLVSDRYTPPSKTDSITVHSSELVYHAPQMRRGISSYSLHETYHLKENYLDHSSATKLDLALKASATLSLTIYKEEIIGISETVTSSVILTPNSYYTGKSAAARLEGLIALVIFIGVLLLQRMIWKDYLKNKHSQILHQPHAKLLHH